MPTLEMFTLLTKLFGSFDTLMDEFAAYKVETIGDAYMAVAGKPGTCLGH